MQFTHHFVRYHGWFCSVLSVTLSGVPSVLQRWESYNPLFQGYLAEGLSHDLIFANQKLSQENLIWNSVMWEETQNMRNTFAQIDYGRDSTTLERSGGAEDSRWCRT